MPLIWDESCNSVLASKVRYEYIFDPWQNEYCRQKSETNGDKTTLYMKLRSSESRVIFLNEQAVGENEFVYEALSNAEYKESLDSNLLLSTYKAIDYPSFSHSIAMDKPEDYGKKDRKFSGFIAYEKIFDRPITDSKVFLVIEDAGEDVEVFVNGSSLGIQLLPPFAYDVTESLQDGQNALRIEVATTLERERGVNRKKQSPIGICGNVYLLM